MCTCALGGAPAAAARRSAAAAWLGDEPGGGAECGDGAASAPAAAPRQEAERGARGEGWSSAWTTLGACAQTARPGRPGGLLVDGRGPPCLAEPWNEEPLTACSTSLGASSGLLVDGRGPPCLAEPWNEEPLTACSTSLGAGSGDTVSVATSDCSGSTGKAADPRTEIEAELGALLASTPVLRRADFDGLVRQHLHAIRTVEGREGVAEAMQMIRDAAADKKRTDVKRWPAYISVLLKRHVRELRQSNSLIKASSPGPATVYQ